jgi:branched-subunit amino acid ABC-type transport system permease component
MVAVDQLALQIFNGLILGLIFVLIASGLSLIFGVLGVINFAHGDLLVVGTYSAWAVSKATGSFFLGVVVATIAVAAVGLFIERSMLQFTYTRSPILQFLLTLGIAEILREGVQIIWGRKNKIFPLPDWGSGSVDLVLFSYPVYRLFVIAVTSVILLGLYLFLNRTDIGIVIRAASRDRDMTGALGVNVERVFIIVFVLGAALAGIAGALIGPIRSVSPTLGVDLLIPSFVVVIIGGLGSLRGSIIGGLIVGQILVLSSFFFSGFGRVLVFASMAVVLLLRPRGLYGREGMFD